MEQFVIRPIGVVRVDDRGTQLEIRKEFIPALTNLEGFGYINVIWWFDKNDNMDSRSKLIEKSPYEIHLKQ